MSRISDWLVTDDQVPVLGAEALVDLLNTWFAGEIGPAWLADDDLGLAATLDRIPGWSSWEDWDGHDRTQKLSQLLGSARTVVTLVPPGHDLAQRLTDAWQGEGWRNADDQSLAVALDEIPGWIGWEGLGPNLELFTAWLTPLPAEWTGAAATEPQTASAQAVEWDQEIQLFRRYNAEIGQYEYAAEQTSALWESFIDGRWLRFDPDAGAWLTGSLGQLTTATLEQEETDPLGLGDQQQDLEKMITEAKAAFPDMPTAEFNDLFTETMIELARESQ